MIARLYEYAGVGGSIIVLVRYGRSWLWGAL